MIARPSRTLAQPLVCAAAYAGAVVAYLPLLGLLVPAEVARLAGEQRYATLALVSVVGAIAAAGGNVLFGSLSDRTSRRIGRRRGGGRRGWIAGGLAAVVASFALFPLVRTTGELVVAIALFQLALNAVLAPLLALIAEEVPEDRAGLTTGLFAIGAPLAALVGLAFAAPAFAGMGARLTLIAAVATACLVPLLMSPRASAAAPTRPAAPIGARRDLAIAWGARLLIQVAGIVVFGDLFYLVGSDDGATALTRTATLMALGSVAPLPVAVLLGRWSDRHGYRRALLASLSATTTLGLAAMAASGADAAARGAAFLVFAIGWNAFLALQNGLIFRLLPDPDHRGRDLGLVNLTNTLPVVIGQGLASAIATPHHPGRLLAVLAALALAAGPMMLATRPQRARDLRGAGGGAAGML